VVEYTKKLRVSAERWSEVLNFLVDNEGTIKAMMLDIVHQDMVYATIELANISHGPLMLYGAAIFPSEAKDKAIAWIVTRPPLYNPYFVRHTIEQYEIGDIVAGVANQLEVEL
jgi:hypothetical protein